MRNRNRDIFFYFLILFGISAFLLFKLFSPFLNVLALALIIAALFSPVNKYLLSHHFHPVAASITTCMLVFLIIFIPVVFVAGSLTSQAYQLYIFSLNSITVEDVQHLFSRDSIIINGIRYIIDRFNLPITPADITAVVQKVGSELGLTVYTQLKTVASNIIGFLLNFMFLLFIDYFLFIDGPQLFRYILELSPMPDDQETMILEKFREISYTILVINGISGIIQGLVGGTVFYLAGIPSAILWGFIMMILAFLPIIGISILFIPASLYFIITGHLAKGLFMFFFFAILTGVIEYIIKPWLVGNTSRIHPLLVFISIIGGLQLFGLTGILYGPITVAVFLVFAEIYKLHYEQYLE